MAMATAGDPEDQTISARVVAIGIPGVSAVAPVGAFLLGGPIHDKPAFAAFTQPGKVLDPKRILVGSTSNFGEPLANPNQLPGAFLSIDPDCPDMLLPSENFAAAGWTGGDARWLRADVQRAEPGLSELDSHSRRRDCGVYRREQSAGDLDQ
jgi:hypothetical protein